MDYIHLYINYFTFANPGNNVFILDLEKGYNLAPCVFSGRCWERALIDSPDSLSKTLTFVTLSQVQSVFALESDRVPFVTSPVCNINLRIFLFI